jgi:hypothetical protein
MEADYQRRFLAGALSHGYAGYATADLRLGESLTLLVEGLLLSGFEVRGGRNTALGNRFFYNRPPTLQRIQEEVLDNRDVLGGRVRAGLSSSADTVLYVNALYRVERPNQPGSVVQLHGWGDLETTLRGARLNLAAGWRDERRDTEPFKTALHADLDLVLPVAASAALHVTSQNELRTLDSRRYARGSTLAGVERTGLGALTVEVGYDTQDRSAGVRNYFVAGIIAARLAEWLELEATVGTQRGGLKCISGVCRDYPAFAGGRLELVARL